MNKEHDCGNSTFCSYCHDNNQGAYRQRPEFCNIGVPVSFTVSFDRQPTQLDRIEMMLKQLLQAKLEHNNK